MRETLTSYLPKSLDISAEDARGKDENLRADSLAVNGSWGPERENFFMFFLHAVEVPSMRSPTPASGASHERRELPQGAETHQDAPLPADRHAETFPSQDDQSNRLRWMGCLMALIPLAGLGTARLLEPSSSGLGTHQQLGLPPCSMRLLFGIRCPGCGMTTSWAHFTRGDWQSSAEASVGGFLLAIFALWIAYLGVRLVRTGRPLQDKTMRSIAIAAAGIFIVALLQWVERTWL